MTTTTTTIEVEPTPEPKATGICRNCNERQATQLWIGDGGSLALVHGMHSSWCAVCCAREQLRHAEAQAARIPEIRAELNLLETVPVLDNPVITLTKRLVEFAEADERRSLLRVFIGEMPDLDGTWYLDVQHAAEKWVVISWHSTEGWGLSVMWDPDAVRYERESNPEPDETQPDADSTFTRCLELLGFDATS